MIRLLVIDIYVKLYHMQNEIILTVGSAYPFSMTYPGMDDTWTPIVTMADVRTLTVDNKATVISADPNAYVYDQATNTWSGLFSPLDTENLTSGPISLTVKFRRPYNPARAYDEIITLYTDVLDCIDEASADITRNNELYYEEQLTNIRNQITKRMNSGVEEYSVFDRNTRYTAIDKLLAMEQSYLAELRRIKYKDIPTQVSFE